MRLLPLPNSRCPWPDRSGLAKAEGLKTARLELFGIALLMEDPLTGGSERVVNQCVPGLKLTECASSTVPILDKSHFCRVNSDRINLQKKKKRMTKFKPIVLHIPEHDTRVHHHLVPPPSEPRTDLPLTRGHLQQAPYPPPPPHYHQFAPSLLV